MAPIRWFLLCTHENASGFRGLGKTEKEDLQIPGVKSFPEEMQEFIRQRLQTANTGQKSGAEASSVFSFRATPPYPTLKLMMSTTDYNLLVEQARALFDGNRDQNANAANLSALVYHGMDRLNWVGFYWWKGSELILGPFQGRPACVRIAMGRGVCGTALQERRVQRVGDVHAFAGHIACDPRSRSEVVIPLFVGAHALGVFDLDSSMVDRFTEEDQAGLERLAALFLESMEPETGRFR